MTEYEIEVIEKLLGNMEKKCRLSKPGKYSGWKCDEIPEDDWPLDKWCSGCLASMVEDIVKTYK